MGITFHCPSGPTETRHHAYLNTVICGSFFRFFNSTLDCVVYIMTTSVVLCQSCTHSPSFIFLDISLSSRIRSRFKLQRTSRIFCWPFLADDLYKATVKVQEIGSSVSSLVLTRRDMKILYMMKFHLL